MSIRWLETSFWLTSSSPFGEYCSALFLNPPDTSVCQKDPKETFFGTKGVGISNFVYSVVKTALPYYFIHAAGPNKGKRSEMPAGEADDQPIYVS